MNKTKGKIIIKNIITFLILFGLIYIAYQFYQLNNFNDLIKSESRINTAEFKRDEEIKYDSTRSYKIQSNEYNDAMFFKEVNVKKNTPYKVTCMVKTNQVESKDNIEGVGAQISVSNTTEKSKTIIGTQDWQKIEMLFNSKNREKVEIGFRLGGVLGEAKGEAWFSNFTLEEGTQDENSNWDFACFIFQNTNVNINNNQISINVTQNEVSDISNTITRFEKSCSQLSLNKMTAKCDIYQIETPITELSYDDEFGYYVSPENVENQIKDILAQNSYDHIFVIVKLGSEKYQNDIKINDWIGLGSMDYYGIGFSNIRLPNDSKNYIYKYNAKINQFPEEVFLHEFLHSLERNAKEYGYERPELHDYEKYGYKNERLIGQKKWYTDYMNKNINTASNEKIGLPSEIYRLKPAKESNFEYSYKIEEFFKEPQNLLEEIQGIWKNFTRNMQTILKQENVTDM